LLDFSATRHPSTGCAVHPATRPEAQVSVTVPAVVRWTAVARRVAGAGPVLCGWLVLGLVLGIAFALLPPDGEGTGVAVAVGAPEVTSLAVTDRPAESIATHEIPATATTAVSQASTPPTRDLLTSSPPALRSRTVATVAAILLIEDDAAIRSALSRAMAERGHAVGWRPAGLSGLQAVVDEGPDVVLLDLGLPDLGGLKVLSMIRAVSDVPVIVVTARDADADIVAALDAGADDFVTKPFGADHLDARIRAVLRRTANEKAGGGPIVVGGLEIDSRSRTVRLDGAPVDLARKEFDLLLALAQRAGEVVSKRDLLAEVWRQPYGGGDRTVDVHLSWLRRKLGETAAAPRYLTVLRGVGVRLAAPTEG
jgi:DNA-binding response OmpR family regulator